MYDFSVSERMLVCVCDKVARWLRVCDFMFTCVDICVILYVWMCVMLCVILVCM